MTDRRDAGVSTFWPRRYAAAGEFDRADLPPRRTALDVAGEALGRTNSRTARALPGRPALPHALTAFAVVGPRRRLELADFAGGILEPALFGRLELVVLLDRPQSDSKFRSRRSRS